MIEIEQTADGSYTLFLTEMNEHYHSIKGAMTESKHIFLEMGFEASPVVNPRVLEIGFGTGLNAFLTYQRSIQVQRKVHYTALEYYPLTLEQVEKMNYTQSAEERELFMQLHRVVWNEDCILSPYFILNKKQVDFISVSLPQNHYDIIYFDAFAPEKQPEMWGMDRIEQLYNSLHEGGILVTYCAKGDIRRSLQKVGFIVERLPGPPQGKREILRAKKLHR